MASREEQETHYHHEPAAGLIHVYSTQRGIWARCERLGLTETARDGGGRSYTGPDTHFRLTVARRRRPSGSPFAAGSDAPRRSAAISAANRSTGAKA